MKIPICHCAHPKCGAKMTRAYVREGGAHGQFIPVGWWCTECGETISDNSHFQKSVRTTKY